MEMNERYRCLLNLLRKNKIYFALVGFSLFAVQAFSQQLVFKHLMTEDGLSQNSIFAIAQDREGFMWYGSRYGLNRYDGYQFSLYKSSKQDTTTLSDDYITALFADKQGVLWVGTANGLNKFNPQKHTFSRISLPLNGKANIYIRQIYQDNAQRLWVATSTGLYVRLTPSGNFILVAGIGLPKAIYLAEVMCIKQVASGKFWVGTNHGLFSFAMQNNKALSIVKYVSGTLPNTLSDNAITDLVEDKQGRLWISTENAGINLLESNGTTFRRFGYKPGGNGLSHHAVRKMLLHSSGQIWIGTQEGLSILDPQNQSFKVYKHNNADDRSINQNSIYSLYEDKDGAVWIGTYYGGVNVVYAHPNPFKKWSSDDGLGYNVISSIVQEGNNFWIGTEGGGLSYVTKNGAPIARYTHSDDDPTSIGSDLIKIVYKDKDGDIWIGTHGGGLNLLSSSTKKFKKFWIEPNQSLATRSEIVALLEDKDGLFWVGSQTGLTLFTKEAGPISPHKLPPVLESLSGKNIKILYQDSRNDIWIGTTVGLYKYNKQQFKLQCFTPVIPSNSVSTNANYFNCITEDGKGNIWVGLYHRGLAKYAFKTNKFEAIYTTKDGLPNDNVVGIVQDHQAKLWISTSNGLSKFDPQTKQFRNYTKADGLAGDEFNYNSATISNNGTIFFGGYQGLTYFYPEDIEENNNVAKLRFTKLLLFNNEVKIGDNTGLLQNDIGYLSKLKFKANQNLFTIQFALLSYSKADKNKYAYKLEGINDKWTTTTLPQATYTNLPSGNYKLWVKGANNDGIWSREEVMHITILPPFYKTWWAICGYILLTAAVVFFIARFFYLRTLLIKDEELHQKKLNFFTNISHEIRTHLTLITLPIERLIDNTKHSQVLNQQLIDIKGYANRLLNLVSELMDFRKAETEHLKLHLEYQDLVAFVKNSLEAFDLLAQKNKFQLVLDTESLSLRCCFDRLQMEKVVFNLISNAFKFTPVGGKISVAVLEVNGSATIKVQDTGRGISPEFMDKLFSNFFQVDDYNVQQTGYGIGLALTKRIVELHKGTIKVDSVQGSTQQDGLTTFTVVFPITQHCKSVEMPMAAVETDYIKNQLEIQERQPLLYNNNTAPQLEGKETILVIEDNVSLCNMLSEILGEHYKVLTAPDGKEGVDVALNNIPDLIITDVMMPELNGLQVCNIIKDDERTNHIPIIMLTAKNTEDDQIQGLTYGADVYISKPFSNKILLLNIQNLLNSQAIKREKFGSRFMLEPSEIVLESRDEKFLTKLIGIIETNMDKEIFSVDKLAETIGMSYSVLNKKLKTLTNMSVNDFSKNIRLKRAAQLLKQKEFNVYEVGYMVGYADRKHFSKEFRKQFGQTPSEFIHAIDEH